MRGYGEPHLWIPPTVKQPDREGQPIPVESTAVHLAPTPLLLEFVSAVGGIHSQFTVLVYGLSGGVRPHCACWMCIWRGGVLCYFIIMAPEIHELHMRIHSVLTAVQITTGTNKTT